MSEEIQKRIACASAERFGVEINAAPEQQGAESLARMLEHRSHRRYSDRPITPEVLQLLFACAFSAPSKSDLQQADIVHVADVVKRTAIADLVADNPWVRAA